MQTEPFRGKRKVAQLLVQQRGCRLLRRGSDGCVPPRCVLTVLLRWMGHGGVANEMWPDEPSVAVLHEELDGFDEWFSQAMARQPSGRSVKTKRGLFQRTSLCREDGREATCTINAAVSDTWRSTASNQKIPVIVNALVATYRLKKFLFNEFGPGCTSLGTTGVERAWWRHHIMNINKSSVWATNAMRQYRAVVAWKAEVRAAIRKLLQRMGTRKYGNREAQTLVEACDTLESRFVVRERQSLLLMETIPDEPPDNEINIGLDVFRRLLRGELDELDVHTDVHNYHH